MVFHRSEPCIFILDLRTSNLPNGTYKASAFLVSLPCKSRLVQTSTYDENTVCMKTINVATVLTRTDPEAGREASWGSEFVPLKISEVESFTVPHTISRTVRCFGIRTFLKTISMLWKRYHSTHRSSISSAIRRNDQQSPKKYLLCFAIMLCGTRRKGPGQSLRNVSSILDFGLDVIETSTGVCDLVTD